MLYFNFQKSVANSDVKPELNSDEEDVIVIDPVPINPCEARNILSWCFRYSTVYMYIVQRKCPNGLN